MPSAWKLQCILLRLRPRPYRASFAEASRRRRNTSRGSPTNICLRMWSATPLSPRDDPVAAILRTQKETAADLVAMGTHGRGGLARIRLGSVAESVLHHAEVPVLTVGPRVQVKSARKAIRRILCPVNYTRSSQTALQHAATLATALGAELIVAHIEEAPLDKDSQESLHRLCDWIPAATRAHCTVKEIVKQGSAADQIVTIAEESQADFLVVGSDPRHRLGVVFLGSTTELVIRSAPCPVLTVIGAGAEGPA